MARARVRELRELPDEELLNRLEGNKEELFNLRFQLATGQLDNPMRIKQVRHDIARILTVLRGRYDERDLERAVSQADRQALERSREAQARGEKKGRSLAELHEEAQIREEAAAGAEVPPPGEEQ